MSDLAKRWTVAVVGIPVVLALLYLGSWPLALPVAALAALGALECYRLAASAGVSALGLLGTTAAAALVLAAEWRPTFSGFAPLALTILVALAGLSLVGALAWRGVEGKPIAAVSVTLFGALYTGLPLAVVPLLHALPEAHGWSSGTAWAGAWVVALPLASTWLGDALALFTGSAWGNGGLAPTISPKKSWVGVWGGLAGAGFAAAVWYVLARPHLPGLPLPNVAVAAGVGVVLGVGAVVGDLAESLMKRDAGVKDSGTIFPGHGGVLDRLDALIVTLPAAYAALMLLERVS